MTGPFAKISRAVLPARISSTASAFFAYPLEITADGASMSTLDVFIAGEDEMPQSNQQVILSSSTGVISPQSATTDTAGHAVFHLTMTEPGTTKIEVMVNGTPLGKSVTIQGL